MNKYLEKQKLKTKEDIAQHIVELKRNTIPDLGLISSLSFYLFDGEKETKTVNMPFGREFLTVVVEKENHNKQRELNEHISEILKDAGTKDHGEVKPNSTRHKASIHCGGYGKSALNFAGKPELKFIIDKKEPIFKDNPNLGEDTFITPDQVTEGIQKGVELLNKIKDNSRKRAVDVLEMGQIVGKKENKNKTDYSEIDWDIIDLMAKRFNDNKHKYPQGNMLKPIDEKELLMALFRHWKKMIQPTDGDEETFEDHLSAILCNAQMIYQQRKLNKS